jgi:hypothetical protein
MTESFIFDPRVFLTNPFEDCPFCGVADQFGPLGVFGLSYVKRCRVCMKDQSYTRPSGRCSCVRAHGLIARSERKRSVSDRGT